MFASIAWIPRGRLLNNPMIYQATEEDGKMARTIIEELNAELQADPEEEEREEENEERESEEQEERVMPESNAMPENVNDDDEEQRDQFQLVNTDNMLICARSAELGFIDCLIYNPQTDDFFFHHNLLVTSIPLCTVYLDFTPQGNGAAGNYCAVSTCSPEIEIWNLDILDSVAPTATLGGFQEVGLKSKRSTPYNHYLRNKRTKQIPLPGSHKDHVLTLSWSPLHRNILASGSVDETIKLWDLNTMKCIATFSGMHKGGPVSCVAFNPSRPGLLASTCLGDRKVIVTSVMESPAVSTVLTVLQADPEQLEWLSENLLCCTTEMGELLVLDVNKDGQDTFLQASLFPLTDYIASIGATISKIPLTGLAVHPLVMGLIAVGSPEVPGIALCAYISGSLTLLHVQPISSPIFSLAWCTGEDSMALAVGSANSTAYILQPFSWTMARPIQEVFGIQFEVPRWKEHTLIVEDDEKEVEDD